MRQGLVVLMILGLLLLIILPACGGGEEKTTIPILTSTPTFTQTSGSTPTVISTPTATPTLTPAEPIKIGLIAPWSGPSAMSGLALIDPLIKLVEKQLKDQGGILGGSEVKFIKYDNRSSVAEAAAGATKLILEDKVSAILYGGLLSPERQATASITDKNNTLLVMVSGSIAEVSMWKYVVNATTTSDDHAAMLGILAKDVLKAKKVAIMATDVESMRSIVDMLKPVLKAAGIDIVYEEYCSQLTIDWSPYLTKIKYLQPDVLISDLAAPENTIALAKQITELGGLGDTKVVCGPGGDSAAKQPGADGWYILALWISGLEKLYPGAATYLDDYQAMYGREPLPSHIYFYNPMWTAIKAIELAGTSDPVKVAEAARSGKLEWDTPIGHAIFTTDGQSGLRFNVGHVEEGKIVPFTVPE